MGKIHLGGEIWQLFVETHLSKLTMRIMLVIAGTIIVLRAIYDLTKDVNGFLLWMIVPSDISIVLLRCYSRYFAFRSWTTTFLYIPMDCIYSLLQEVPAFHTSLPSLGQGAPVRPIGCVHVAHELLKLLARAFLFCPGGGLDGILPFRRVSTTEP